MHTVKNPSSHNCKLPFRGAVINVYSEAVSSNNLDPHQGRTGGGGLFYCSKNSEEPRPPFQKRTMKMGVI